MEDDDECPCCSGDGLVFECLDGCCEDADFFGCDDCIQPCPVCNQVRNTGDELGQVLADAIETTKKLPTG